MKSDELALEALEYFGLLSAPTNDIRSYICNEIEEGVLFERFASVVEVSPQYFCVSENSFDLLSPKSFRKLRAAVRLELRALKVISWLEDLANQDRDIVHSKAWMEWSKPNLGLAERFQFNIAPQINCLAVDRILRLHENVSENFEPWSWKAFSEYKCWTYTRDLAGLIVDIAGFEPSLPSVCIEVFWERFVD